MTNFVVIDHESRNICSHIHEGYNTYHQITIRNDIRTSLCQQYTDDCCIDKDCKNAHCDVSAFHFAKQNSRPVHESVEKLLWARVLQACLSNMKYRLSMINPMHKILESVMCKSVRNIIASYIGDDWIIIKEQWTDQDRWRAAPCLIRTINRKVSYIAATNWDPPSFWTGCCKLYGHGEFIAIKKENNEFLVTFLCDKCYNPRDSESLYNLNLINFKVFPINKSGDGIVSDTCVMNINGQGELEILKFDDCS